MAAIGESAIGARDGRDKLVDWVGDSGKIDEGVVEALSAVSFAQGQVSGSIVHSYREYDIHEVSRCVYLLRYLSCAMCVTFEVPGRPPTTVSNKVAMRLHRYILAAQWNAGALACNAAAQGFG
jgi:hypothetical protein